MSDVKQTWGTCGTCPHFEATLGECRFVQPPWHPVKLIDWCSRHPDRQISINERMQELMRRRAEEQQRQVGAGIIVPRRRN